jgi:hypothetical protein
MGMYTFCIFLHTRTRVIPSKKQGPCGLRELWEGGRKGRIGIQGGLAI